MKDKHLDIAVIVAPYFTLACGIFALAMTGNYAFVVIGCIPGIIQFLYWYVQWSYLSIQAGVLLLRAHLDLVSLDAQQTQQEPYQKPSEQPQCDTPAKQPNDQ